MRVEVFKTNVNYLLDAEILVREIHRTFPSYSASFDLEDCDRILRVECVGSDVKSEQIISLLDHFNFSAEILKDEIVNKQHYQWKK